jgi:hypothetical protein
MPATRKGHVECQRSLGETVWLAGRSSRGAMDKLNGGGKYE